MKTTKLMAHSATLGLLFFAASAFAHENTTWKERLESGNLGSDEHRAANAPRADVMVPPTGVPMVDQSTVDTSGNGMARRDRFDIYSEEYVPSRRRAELRRDEWRMRHVDRDRVNDETVSRSAAPNAEYRHFVVYGDDIPALRGLQLEMALNRLHHINQKEIEFAKLAESRAKSADVLNLAHRIRGDHEALDKRVEAIADRRNVKLESYSLSTFEKAERDRLKKLDAPVFEAAFLRINDRGNDETMRELRMVRNDLGDSETRILINETLPRMSAHVLTPSENRARARTEEGEFGR